MGQILKELYNKEDDVHDGIACDIVTTMLELPGVREAVIVAALDWTDSLKHVGVECVGDIPFQYAWDFIFNQEE